MDFAVSVKFEVWAFLFAFGIINDAISEACVHLVEEDLLILSFHLFRECLCLVAKARAIPVEDHHDIIFTSNFQGRIEVLN